MTRVLFACHSMASARPVLHRFIAKIPNDDDWLKIQFQFLINEMPVTDASRKVRNVIKRRQADGEWLCAGEVILSCECRTRPTVKSLFRKG